MATTRYVWEKWNKQSNIYYSRKDTAIPMANYNAVNKLYDTGLSYTGNTWKYKTERSPSPPTIAGSTFDLSTYSNGFISSSNLEFILATPTVAFKVSTSILARIPNTAGTVRFYAFESEAASATLYKYEVVQNSYYSKGSTSYGSISSSSANAYPSNGESGNYWYISKGSDNIDPVSLTYTDAVKAGENVTLTITPSTGTTLGGNISYVLQTTVNGTDWYDADTTSETTCTLTVPADAIIWGVRVYAKDDTGFISETYVYGNGIEGTVNVIRVGISPPSGNIGYITNKNVMVVSVNADSAYTFTVKMNGETLSSSSSSSSTVEQITLTDEKFNALEEDTPYTLTVEIVISGTTTTREYTFRKFIYDSTTTEGVWTGIGRAIRIRRKMQSQILGASAPNEIIKIDNPVSTQELQAATATPDKVVSGYTFYAGNDELKTGTGALQRKEGTFTKQWSNLQQIFTLPLSFIPGMMYVKWKSPNGGYSETTITEIPSTTWGGGMLYNSTYMVIKYSNDTVTFIYGVNNSYSSGTVDYVIVGG